MDYYGNNDFRDYRNGSYLAHYGRKGMRKGKHLPGTTWWKDLIPGANGQIDPQQVKVAQAQAMYAQQRMQNARANEATARNAAAIRDQREKEGRNAEVNARNEALAAKKDKEAIQSRQDAYGKMALSQNKAEEAAKNAEKEKTEKKEKEKKETEKKIDDIVEKVINGNYGNGEARKKALAKEGYDYAEIQNKVNEKLGSSVRHESEKTKESSEAKAESSSQSSKTSNTMSAKEHAGRTAEAAARSGTTAKAEAKKKVVQARADEATVRAKQERKRQKKQKKASAKRVKRVKKKAADISAKNERYARIGKNQVVLEPDKKNYMLKM